MDIRLAFIFGLVATPSLQNVINNESQSYGDIIQSSTFFDSYKNLTFKSMSMLRWVNGFCPEVGLLLKTDDDMFIKVDNLLRCAEVTVLDNQIIVVMNR